MKIKFIDNLTFEIYIKNEIINSINENSKEELEKFLKELLKKIKYRYNLKIEGFYSAIAYIDKHYGIIFDVRKEELNYYDYLNGQVDINIDIKKKTFLYKVDYIPHTILNRVKIVNKDSDIFLKINNKLNKKEMMYLTEHTEKILKM